MNISLKGKYALQAMVDLTTNCNDYDRGIPIADIATRQNIDIPFLEKILVELKKAGLVISRKGPKGGHALAKDASDISVFEILIAVEENLKFTRCSQQSTKGGCLHEGLKCLPHKFWKDFENNLKNFMGSYTLQEVCYGKDNTTIGIVAC